MKNITIRRKAGYFLACVTGLVLVLSACSSEDVAQVLSDEFIAISGQVTSGANPAGETGVTVKGIYSDNNPLNASTTTGTNGTFTLNVLKSTPVSLQVSKSGSNFVILNSAREEFSADMNGFDIELVTTAEANAVIDLAAPGQSLASGAWLAVNVVDGTGTEVDGATINTAPKNDLVFEAATDCTGMDSGDVITIYDPCVPERDGPMYFAYFSADTEVTVNVTGVAAVQTAPVRAGEVTFLEFTQ